MTDATTAVTRQFSVLFVCTGNICRSALGAQLLKARLDGAGVTAGGHLIRVSSAGTGMQPELTMPREVVEQSRRFGGDPSNHVARQLDRDIVAEADLILTATREHRSDVARLLPRASRVTFTVPQFARLIAETEPAADLRELVASVAAERGLVPPPANPDDDDIEDPYRRSSETYERVGAQIKEFIDIIATHLAQSGDRR
ncbi:low molecular weight phosphatase family protein [Plantibacter cousiniae (nom. nud.)]|uniref:Protein-tyrosine phosphatase n=1 Tax=Plantibacter cousiniae (nom. nud.) TaxID=199709 RepID=A0ABY1LPG1_9MICO|nr:low molecular weight phosphatase family protein [Plantibacter cousiniae]SKC70386.1 protein-tyrosine phosphatase [Plantibacter cousiniae]